MIAETHPAVAELIESGRQRGFITYDELNALLPDEMVEPDKIDELLVKLDAMEIKIIDAGEGTVPGIRPPQASTLPAMQDSGKPIKMDRKAALFAATPEIAEPEAAEEPAPVAEVKPAKPSKSKTRKAAEPVEIKAPNLEVEGSEDNPVLEEVEEINEEELKKDIAQALQEASSRRIDDPVRMYLTQMGEISLLTREEEIRLAKKIETTRMIFRRKVLENDYSIQAAVEILEMVEEGDLPFDRTMKISTAEEDAKGKIAARIPENLKTVRKMLELNRADWEKIEQLGKKNKTEANLIRAQIKMRRRKMATLIEELSLRTSKVQPLLKKLRSICEKMIDLRDKLARADVRPDDFDAEDVMVMRDELSGMRSLVLEDPEELLHRVSEITTVFDEYESAKRDLSGGNLRLVVSIAKKYRRPL